MNLFIIILRVSLEYVYVNQKSITKSPSALFNNPLIIFQSNLKSDYNIGDCYCLIHVYYVHFRLMLKQQ